jgi:hypothetical protein
MSIWTPVSEYQPRQTLHSVMLLRTYSYSIYNTLVEKFGLRCTVVIILLLCPFIIYVKYSGAAMSEINQRRLSDIICENTDLPDLTEHVFVQVQQSWVRSPTVLGSIPSIPGLDPFKSPVFDFQQSWVRSFDSPGFDPQRSWLRSPIVLGSILSTVLGSILNSPGFDPQ